MLAQKQRLKDRTHTGNTTYIPVPVHEINVREQKKHEKEKGIFLYYPEYYRGATYKHVLVHVYVLEYYHW